MEVFIFLCKIVSDFNELHTEKYMFLSQIKSCLYNSPYIHLIRLLRRIYTWGCNTPDNKKCESS